MVTHDDSSCLFTVPIGLKDAVSFGTGPGSVSIVVSASRPLRSMTRLRSSRWWLRCADFLVAFGLVRRGRSVASAPLALAVWLVSVFVVRFPASLVTTLTPSLRCEDTGLTGSRLSTSGVVPVLGRPPIAYRRRAGESDRTARPAVLRPGRESSCGLFRSSPARRPTEHTH